MIGKIIKAKVRVGIPTKILTCKILDVILISNSTYYLCEVKELNEEGVTYFVRTINPNDIISITDDPKYFF